MTTTRTARRIVAVIALAATISLSPLPISGASATSGPKGPELTVSGSGTWQIREWIEDVVVNGTGQFSGRNGRATDVLVAAVIQTDDRTLPAPGECEYAFATMSAYGARGVDFTMVGGGDVCGQWADNTSIVTHVFTGRYEVYGEPTSPKRLEGTDGWYEIRLTDEGTASVFAVDT